MTVVLPEEISGWSEYLREYIDFIKKNGRMSGEDADKLALTSKPKMTIWKGKQDMGDRLVNPSCSHIYRLHRFVDLGVLRKEVIGESPDQVFYYLPDDVAIDNP